MARLTNVEFYRTGGGCVQYSAKVNDDAWIATDFDSLFYYDKKVTNVDDDYLNNDIPYESHYKTPAGSLPTWGEIFQSIHDCVPSEYETAKIIMKDFDLDAVCTQGWEINGKSEPDE